MASIAYEVRVCDRCFKKYIYTQDSWIPINEIWCMECNDTEYKRRYGEAKWNEECKKAVLAGKPFSLEKNKKNQLCLGYLARGEIEIRPICSIDEVGP